MFEVILLLVVPYGVNMYTYVGLDDPVLVPLLVVCNAFYGGVSDPVFFPLRYHYVIELFFCRPLPLVHVTLLLISFFFGMKCVCYPDVMFRTVFLSFSPFPFSVFLLYVQFPIVSFFALWFLLRRLRHFLFCFVQSP